jgi:tetratricopeptide (TPR) repeat protein
MAHEAKQEAAAAAQPFQVVPSASDRDKKRQQAAFAILLAGIRELGQARGQTPKAFISYAWPPAGPERNELQAFLKSLQEKLEAAGITVFFDLRDMKGDLDDIMREKLLEADFVLPILTPQFLKRVTEGYDAKTSGKKPNNLFFEFELTLEKARLKPNSVMPILRSGAFGEVVTGHLAPLRGKMIYTCTVGTRTAPLLVGLSDPLGFIPVMYNIRIGDQAYQDLLRTWLDGSLTRLPQVLPDVVERQVPLHQLTSGFAQQARQGVSPVQILQGTGGVGKTQLATLYANQQYADKSFVRWVYADQHNLQMEWQKLGELLGLELKGIEEAKQRRQIRQALSERESWLIVLDNLEDLNALKGLLPERQLPTQQVLITTRSENWGKYPVISLPPFTPEECQTYMQARLAQAQCEGVEALAKEMGYMPLALSHAVSYMKDTGTNAAAYLKLYKEKGIVLLRKQKEGFELEGGNARHDHAVFTTYTLSMERLTAQNPQEAELVKFCAYLDPENIEERFLKHVLGIDEETLDDYLRDSRKHGLLTREATGFKMHRLVQATIRYDEAQSFSKEALWEQRLRPLAKMIQGLYPYEKKVEDYQKAALLLPHLIAVSTYLSPLLTHALAADDRNENRADHWQAALFDAIGNFHWSVSGDAQKALTYQEKALGIWLQVYGEAHPLVATSYSNLGSAYEALGDAQKALTYQEKSLAIKLQVYGEAHPSVATSYNNLGLAYKALGDAQKALTYHEKALGICLQVYGEAHPSVATSYSNLGTTYSDLGDAQKALTYQEKALRIFLQVYGEAHPDVATSYNNLGNAYDSLGDAQKALTYQGKALRIFLQVYGEAHPSVATSYNNLGLAYKALGDAQQALTYQEKALSIRLQVYGEAHPSVALGYYNVGSILYPRLNKPTEARENLMKSLAIYQQFKLARDIADVERLLAKLPASRPTTRLEAAALRDYPGTLLNQEQQRAMDRVGAAKGAEEKLDGSDADKKSYVIS